MCFEFVQPLSLCRDGGGVEFSPAPKEDNAGNVNTPGSNAGSKQSAAKANTADGTDGSAKKSAIGS